LEPRQDFAIHLQPKTAFLKVLPELASLPHVGGNDAASLPTGQAPGPLL
jgi:hypothetical protein